MIQQPNQKELAEKHLPDSKSDDTEANAPWWQRAALAMVNAFRGDSFDAAFARLLVLEIVIVLLILAALAVLLP